MVAVQEMASRQMDVDQIMKDIEVCTLESLVVVGVADRSTRLVSLRQT